MTPALLSALLLAAPPAAPVDPPAAPAAADPPAGLYAEVPAADHDPNGIGTAYMGREIARVMSYHGAPWLERDAREREEGLSTLIELLNLEPGMTVADIGAGSGVITALLAEAVGPTGTVLAVDIQPEMLALLREKMASLGFENVTPVRGEEADPKLPAGSVDLALMVDVYHEFEYPHEMTAALAKSLKPGGRLVWVEYRLEDPTVPIKRLHKMSVAQVRREASRPEFGLEFVDVKDELPRQHVITFRRPPAPTGE